MYPCDLEERAQEIAEFLGVSPAEALRQLARGFGELHVEVAKDFKRANPKSDAELLEWYRATTAFIYELTAYHMPASGFNYSGMVAGIAFSLMAEQATDVLCLGDGVGDLSYALAKKGVQPVYNDLAGSLTAGLAQYRFSKMTTDVRPRVLLTEDWTPAFPPESHGAVVALDVMEHIPNVSEWTEAIRNTLRPGGVVFFQNAFNMGSDGSIAGHLRVNDHFEKDWDPLLESLGFVRVAGTLWRKP